MLTCLAVHYGRSLVVVLREQRMARNLNAGFDKGLKDRRIIKVKPETCGYYRSISISRYSRRGRI